jgi:S1-C subfamily serine protease
MNTIRNFESWLKNGHFIPLTALLVMANITVYMWWSNNRTIIFPADNVRNAIFDGLNQEKTQLQSILNSDCNSVEMRQFHHGEIGPFNIDKSNNAKIDTNETHTTPQSASQLAASLERATVRILAGNAIDTDGVSTGSGFFISNNLVVTNRHVVEKADQNKIYITSQYLGTNPIKATLLAMTPDTKFANPDFALLKVDNLPKPILTLPIGIEPVALQAVIGAGYPGDYIQFDMNQETPATFYSRGSVSVLQKQPNGMTLVVHTADMAPGSSGGPLINNCLSLVGVNTFLTQSKESSRTLYALSAESLREFLDKNHVVYTKFDGACTISDNQ